MISMAEAKPLRPTPIDDTPYSEQRSLEAKCITGADAGIEVLYKTASVGGMRGIDDLLIEIQAQLSSPGGVDHPCPVIVCGADSYTHKKWGQIYTPILEVTGWADMEGQLAAAAAAPVEKNEPAAPKPAPRGKSTKPALKAAETASANGHGVDATLERGRKAQPVQEPPVSTTQEKAHVGQRRRPTTR